MNHKIHLLGICGTLMAGVARLAKEMGYDVSGSDNKLAPPMSDQLHDLGIALDDNMHSPPQADTILTGNILSRGQPIVEALLDHKMPYQSAPDWLYQNILHCRPVIAIAGTHGKTTTTSMIAWILEKQGLNPGFLIGGVAENFGVSSRLGKQNAPFVIEADEYDTAFFDKRPKFLHYHPDILLINNLEFDHADIYENLTDIQKQFHYLLRQLPAKAKIIYPKEDQAIQTVIQQGCWSQQITLRHENEEEDHQHPSDWQLRYQNVTIEIITPQGESVIDSVPVIGAHNRHNMLSAIAVCHQLGISAKQSLDALKSFRGVKRRLQIKGQWNLSQVNQNKAAISIRLIDDFAHHPTAIRYTLETLKYENPQNNRTLMALLDLTSNSMKQGAHKHLLADSLIAADKIFIWQNERIQWDVNTTLRSENLAHKLHIYNTIDMMIDGIMEALWQIEKGPEINSADVIMLSNGQFGGLSDRLVELLNRSSIS